MRFAALVALVALGGCLTNGLDATPSPAKTEPPPVEVEVIAIDTEVGRIVAVLYETWRGEPVAPDTVSLMRQYEQERYYDGREFNRVVPGHVIQVTDKALGATDDPKMRTVTVERHPDFDFSAGALGIARGAEENSGGPEFFIADFATSHLYQGFTVWGQVIEGLDLVHRIARTEAVEAPRLPPPAPFVGDRIAVDAVAIRTVKIEKMEIPGALAAALPHQVALNARVGDFRHSLEWPLNASSEAPSMLTWYVRAGNGSAPPAVADVTIAVEGESYPVTGEPTTPGVYHWLWRVPPEEGEFDATIHVTGTPMATLKICVPLACPKPHYK